MSVTSKLFATICIRPGKGKKTLLPIAIWISGLIFLYKVTIDPLKTRRVQQDKMPLPLLKFGVFADVQYADVDNKKNFEQTRWRYYRDSIIKVKQIMNVWNDDDPVKFGLNLGDLIDGQAKRKGESEKCLADILNCLEDFSGNVYHTWGNHDFYNFQRERLNKKPDLHSANAVRLKKIIPDGKFSSPEGKAYYSFQPHQKLRIIMLDHYEFSVLGWEKDSLVYIRALAFLKSKNTNEDLNDSTGLHGAEGRFAMYNGAATISQLQWLENQIRDAERVKQWVIVAGHIPVHEATSRLYCLLWNYEAILEILHRHRNVALYLAGHDHEGGYAIDKNGTHHLTMNGLIEAEPGTLDYATFHLYPTELHVRGNGRVPSFVIQLPDL